MVDYRQQIIEFVKEENRNKKALLIAAVICTLLREYKNSAVVVGGSALEFYSVSNYATLDIDFVARDSQGIKEVMLNLGFVNNGGTYILDIDPTVIVEFPKGPLAGDTGRVINVAMTSELSVNIIGIEDILIDRLCAAKFWGDGSEQWVKFLMLTHYTEIDWRYCLKRAREEQCEDTFRKCRDFARRQRKEIGNKK